MWSFIKYPKKENITGSWDEYGLTPGATNYITTPKNIITLTGIKQWVIAQSTHLKSELERRNGRNAWLSYELYIYVRCVCFIIFLLFSSLMKEPRMNDVTLARSILFLSSLTLFKEMKTKSWYEGHWVIGMEFDIHRDGQKCYFGLEFPVRHKCI